MDSSTNYHRNQIDLDDQNSSSPSNIPGILNKDTKPDLSYIESNIGREYCIKNNLLNFDSDSDLNEYIYNCKQLEIPVDPAVASTLATHFQILEPTGDEENGLLLPLLKIMKNNQYITKVILPPITSGTTGNIEAHIIGLIISENKSIKELTIKQMNLGIDGLHSLCLGLSKNTSITHIDLSNNYIGPEAAHLIAEMISINSTLTYLDMSNNNFEYSGEQVIKEAAQKRLKEKGLVMEIDSHGNYIYEEMLNTVIFGLGMLMSIIALFLLFNSIENNTPLLVKLARIIYGLSMVLCYAISTSVHGTHQMARWIHKLFLCLEYCSIYFLIAGIYTVICVEALSKRTIVAEYILAGEWIFCSIGMMTHIALSYWKRNEFVLYLVESILFVVMGWAGLFAIPWLISSFTTPGIVMIFVGGGMYTIGVVFYFVEMGVKVPIFRVIWSIFVFFGSLTIFVGIFYFMDIGDRTISGTILKSE